MGYRMVTAAMEELAATRSEDEELVAIVETDSCGVDALQCVTGCTFGKGNLVYRDYGKHAYTVFSRSTGSGVRVMFHGKGIPESVREESSAFAAWVLSADAESIFTVTPTTAGQPKPATVMSSVTCAFCGEAAMESRIKQLDGKPACIPCYEKRRDHEQAS